MSEESADNVKDAALQLKNFTHRQLLFHKFTHFFNPYSVLVDSIKTRLHSFDTLHV
jgi:hypothetical protein